MQRQSIRPTFDSRECGDQYSVTVWVGGRRVFQRPIPDPFVRQTVAVGRRDLLRGLLRRHLVVEVTVDAGRDRVEDVLELDDNYRGVPGSTRRADSEMGLRAALEGFATGLGE